MGSSGIPRGTDEKTERRSQQEVKNISVITEGSLNHSSGTQAVFGQGANPSAYILPVSAVVPCLSFFLCRPLSAFLLLIHNQNTVARNVLTITTYSAVIRIDAV
ncbi:uncharacterized protein [Bemisia tabaci]|uniref:uncharacterized protein isoform X2 n=1 Tax=Bemisia tabaci TaxID=7038 RepID=UPI003B28B01A